MITICSRLSTIAEVHKLVCEFRVTSFNCYGDAELMGVIPRTVKSFGGKNFGE